MFYNNTNIIMCMASLVAQPAKQEMQQEQWVRSLGQEDPAEEEMTTHSIIVWEIPWTEQPGRLQSTGSQRVGHDLRD